VAAEEYETMCIHSSEKEKNAADAERASIKYKQVEFMKDVDRDKPWNGIVSGVTEWGVYVEIIENKCEGLVRIADLDDDFYEFDPQNYRLIGRSNKNIITFGDPVVVTVKNTNLNDRTIDLTLIGRGTIDENQVIEAIVKQEKHEKPFRRSKNVKDEFGFDV
jgi:ribonuclease R